LAFEEGAMMHGVRVGSSDRLRRVDWIKLYKDIGQFWIFGKEAVMIVVP
jgi:hypothetical protein